MYSRRWFIATAVVAVFGAAAGYKVGPDRAEVNLGHGMTMEQGLLRNVDFMWWIGDDGERHEWTNLHPLPQVNGAEHEATLKCATKIGLLEARAIDIKNAMLYGYVWSPLTSAPSQCAPTAQQVADKPWLYE